VPELVTGPVRTDPRDLVRVAYDVEATVHAVLDPRVKGRVKEQEEPPAWQTAPQ
jgi:hypothetical protein